MTDSNSDQPLIVLGDFTLLLEIARSRLRAAREALIAFAELVKTPEHSHTYRITPLSIWNARAAGMEPGRILETLEVSTLVLTSSVSATRQWIAELLDTSLEPKQVGLPTSVAAEHGLACYETTSSTLQRERARSRSSDFHHGLRVSIGLGDDLLPAAGITSHAHDLVHSVCAAAPVFTSSVAHRRRTSA